MDATFWSDLDAGMAEIAATMFADGVLTHQTKAYDAAQDRSVTTSVTAAVLAIRDTETIEADNGALTRQTVAYIRSSTPPRPGDLLTIGTNIDHITALDAIDPVGTPLLYRAVLA
jgi:hypothetical protein